MDAITLDNMESVCAANGWRWEITPTKYGRVVQVWSDDGYTECSDPALTVNQKAARALCAALAREWISYQTF